MTSYHSLQDCFFERLPASGDILPLADDTFPLDDASIIQSEHPSLSDEQVSLLASDLAASLEGYESDLSD